jgi:hypothetical protein
MRILCLLLLFGSLLFAQLDSNTVTVTASRQIYPAPDEVLFGLTLTSGTQTNLDDVTSALRAAGVSAAQFSGLSTSYGDFAANSLQWGFTLTAPLSNLKDTSALLTAAQKAIGVKGSGLSLSFNIQGAQASEKQRSAVQCSQADLIADAQAQAKMLAVAAGMSLGSILSLSDPATAVYGNTNGYAAFLITGAVSFQPFAIPVTCSLTVKFGLSRY